MSLSICPARLPSQRRDAMLNFLHRRILLPAFETGVKRRKTFAYWRELERTQWLSRSELEQIQLAALQRLIRHASDHCPYYQTAWRSRGLDAKGLQELADFSAWPVITRDTVRENRMDMRAVVPGLRLIAKSTGGSSGVPLQFDLDLNSADRRAAVWHRGYSWAGAAPGTRQFYLWGTNLQPGANWRRRKDQLYNRLYRKRVWSCFDMTEQRVPALLDDLNRYRPEVIVAYTKPLYELARRLDEQGIRPFQPRSIVVGAEKLHDFEREVIERVFAAPVFETYGSREFMLIGAECDRHNGIHLNMEHLLVEVLDATGLPTPAGQEGEVVVTDLYNYGMPFVRYATGDRAVAGLETCSCGRGLPLLKKIVGRQLDMLRTPDGRLIPGEFFPHLIKDYRAVRRFQVVQERPDLVVLRLVVDATWNAETAENLQDVIRRTLGPMARLDIQRVDDIPLTAAGKLQVVINRTPCGRAA
jgi:phenylacetate-CoA ligase